MKHPKLNEQGLTVHLKKPHACTPLSNWSDATALATAIPGCPLPPALNGIPFAAWEDLPPTPVSWQELASGISEPVFKAASGYKTASGAAVVEPDGRVWMVSPSNAFGGYVNTFPKGTLSSGSAMSLAGNAVKEVWEETGLKVCLTGFLCDCQRSTSVTRYYVARRIGGSPADMGWESQAVHLVPIAQLDAMASHSNDRPIVQALKKL